MTQDQDHRLLGTTLSGRYRLDALLGQGGFAVVFRARDLALEQDVALKLMSPHLLDSSARDAFLKRFEREAKLVASFQHAHIARVFDTSSITEEGYTRPYLVMEFLNGQDLQDILETEKWLSPARSIDLMLQALDALAHVHERGVIHRDLKPANLFVTPSTGLREREHLHVMDFGIALHDQFADDRLTATKGTIGTMHYLPPEYLEYGEITPAMDTYQIGLILCELMTGQPMVEGSGLQAAFKVQRMGVSLPDVFHGHRCESFLLKAIDRDPRLRFQNAAQMYTALEALAVEDFPEKPHAHHISAPGQPFYLDDTLAQGEAPPQPTQKPLRAPSTTAPLTDARPRPAAPEPTLQTDKPPKRRLAALVGALLLLITAGVAAAAITTTDEEKPATKTEETTPQPPREDIATLPPQTSPTPKSVEATTPPEEAPTHWSWKITSSPAGAQVWVEEELRGETPLELSFERSSIKKVQIELRARGYKRETFKSLTNSDRTIDIELEPEKQSAPPRNPKVKKGKDEEKKRETTPEATSPPAATSPPPKEPKPLIPLPPR
jgi:serine/threonine protein kinase